MEGIGYIASLLIGISLGLIGGGGSILTVPVMVYLFGLHPLLATSYSLFIVGTTSLVGAFTQYRKGLVNLKAALFFGAASVLTVFLTRRFLVPAIPHDILTIGNYTLSSSVLTMVLFALLMLVASIGMIREKNNAAEAPECPECIRLSKLLGYGVAIGLITGLLGAGGGFLLIPALVFLLRLPMKKAVGTSLLIIALNSLIGFAGDLGQFSIDWWFLLKIALIAIAGIFIGGALSVKIPGGKLKKGFGWFVLVMGIYIILKETILTLPQ
ncbi:sulfite exporter TauE/SafE family protein [Paracnuella aquatica]|uniref:sulfite exporter TauE/SafE family protein n=1 Tax=Paracnuella aquatica TaxID=2268757 RepID=UPI000DEF324E|nr:sulfite exporter TauE/SafE family protein [Paracnuella aquatica]RPD49205.1 sulfite exporter TauE/SafE family protein [Paracnuella aquatica]